jgi:hypothetical protein
MKTHVEFKSKSFPPYEGEEERINPGVWGKRLAEYLVGKLPEHGFTPREMNAEDWGWYIPIENETFPLAVCCGHQDGESDQFICFIDPWKPQIRKLFKKIDTTQRVVRLADALDRILASHPDIKEINWMEDQEK